MSKPKAQKMKADTKPSWEAIARIVGAVAGLITALATLLGVLVAAGVIDLRRNDPDSPTPQTGTLEPGVANLRFCNRDCQEAGSAFQDTFPEGAQEIWAAWDYQGMERGAAYTREWLNRGEVWVRYECVWQGSESGTWSLRLHDAGGLRSGEWELIITVEDQIVARASVQVEGNHTFWDPAGNPPCPDWQAE